MPKKIIPEAFKGLNGGLPYSEVIQVGNHFHFAGMVPNLDENKKLVSSDLAEQTREVLAKMKDKLAKCGLAPSDLLDVTIAFIGKGDEYKIINQEYSAWLKEENAGDKPIRFATAAAWLPFDALVEFKPIAVKQD